MCREIYLYKIHKNNCSLKTACPILEFKELIGLISFIKNHSYRQFIYQFLLL
jgi:hypothetical protein